MTHADIKTWVKDRITIVTIESEKSRDLAHKLLDESPDGTIFELRPPRRSDDQNRRFHASIRSVARQAEWCGDNLSEEDWKRLFLASFYGQKVVKSLLGGFVVISKKSSEMNRADLAELQEFIYAWGTEHGVTFEEE